MTGVSYSRSMGARDLPRTLLPPPRDYRLADGVYCCLIGESAVFLDLPRNKYLCVRAPGNSPLRELAESLPQRASDPSSASMETANSLRPLVEEHLLTIVAADTPLTHRRTISSSTHILIDDDENVVTTKGRDVARFLFACLAAHRMLRRQRMEEIVGSVHLRAAAIGYSSDAETVARAHSRVAVFNKLRPGFPRDYLCLFDSLALLRFLSADGLCPRWVFGVRLDPFQAHCWVQCGTVLFNDELEHIRTYTPIMAI